jgi:hypothetical protein
MRASSQFLKSGRQQRKSSTVNLKSFYLTRSKNDADLKKLAVNFGCR